MKRKRGTEETFKVKLAAFSTKLMTDTKPQIQEVLRTPNMIIYNQVCHNPTAENKRQSECLKRSQTEKNLISRGKSVRVITDFPSEIMQERG